jgi:hypothetical protein
MVISYVGGNFKVLEKVVRRIGLFLVIGMIILVTGTSFAKSRDTREYEYQGYNKCKGCHGKEFKSWKEGAMNREAFKALKPGERAEAKVDAGLDPNKDYTSEPECLACHATGYGRPGGFVSAEKTPDLAGVTCEACHGPGEYYWRVMVKKRRTYTLTDLVKWGFIPPDQGICDQCHTPGCPIGSDTYDYDEAAAHDNFPLRFVHSRDLE